MGFPLNATAPLPCMLAVASSASLVAIPEYSKTANQGWLFTLEKLVLLYSFLNAR